MRLTDQTRRFFVILRALFRIDRRRAILSFVPIGPASTGLSYLAVRNLLQALPGDDRASIAWAAILFSGSFGIAAWIGRASRTARLQLGEAATFDFQTRRAASVLAHPGTERLEDPAYLDRLETLRARSFDVNQAPRMFGWLVDSLGGLAVSILLLVSVEPWLGLVAIGGIPSALLNGREQRRVREAESTEAESSRRAVHLYGLATSPEAATEVRVAGVGDELIERYQREWRRADARRYRAELRAGMVAAAGWLAQAATFAVGTVALVDATRTGSISPADMFIGLGAMSLIVGQVGQAVGGVTNLGQILSLYDDLRALEDEAEHARPESRAAAAPDRLEHGIRFEAVSFRYPGAQEHALIDLDLELAAGQVVAIVGANGAGKTTLVNLLHGFHRPTSGRILVDGTPIDEIGLTDWRDRSSACLQDYVRFSFPARETIGIGSLPHLDDEARILDAVERAAATSVIDQLEDGLDTQLGSALGGAELSGGQWQRTAISRAMMRDEPLLLVLDEPASSLDPLAEHEIFQTYARAAAESARARGCVTILISHRFSTVSMADHIVVLDEGRVVEHGAHAQLVDAGGVYAHMYETQAKHYRSDAAVDAGTEDGTVDPTLDVTATE